MAISNTTIAVMNGKGGVGKTSVVANLSALFAASGQRVLAVDLDPQGNLAEDLGHSDDDGKELAAAISTRRAPRPVKGVRENLDVLPGGYELEELNSQLIIEKYTTGAATETWLAESLTPLASDYDYVFLDCPPGYTDLQVSALVASRWVLVPVRSDSSSRKGLRRVASRFQAATLINPELELLGVLLFGVTGSASRVAAGARESLERDLGGVAPVLQTRIRQAEAAADATRGTGRVAHEIGEVLDLTDRKHELFKWLRSKDRSEPLPPASITGLAQDYALLAGELDSLIAEKLQEGALHD